MTGLNSSFLSFDEALEEVLSLQSAAGEEAEPLMSLDATSLLRKKEPKQSVAELLLRCILCIDCCSVLVFDEELRHDLSDSSVAERRIGGRGVSAADAENSSLCSLILVCCAENAVCAGRSRSDRPAAAARASSRLSLEEGDCWGSKAPQPALAGKIDRRGEFDCCCCRTTLLLVD